MRDEEVHDRPGLVRKRARSIILRRLLTMFVVVYMVATTAIVVITLTAVVSCTDPDGDCAKRGLKAQERAINELIRATQVRADLTREIVVAAAACAQHHDTVNAIQRCVDEKIKEK